MERSKTEKPGVEDLTKQRFRFVKDIGLWAFSRGRHTCKWRTAWCSQRCYNNKFYRLNPKLDAFDAKDEEYWQAVTAEQFVADMPEQITRFRFAIRGEIWTSTRDVVKVSKILRARPDVLFWIPTRAWVAQGMQEAIVDHLFTLPNARIMASTDPTVAECTEQALSRAGWSTVFAGDNDNPAQTLLLNDYGPCAQPAPSRLAGKMRCPKTWEYAHGHCAVCASGCFSDKRVDVHLRQHR